MDFNAPSGSTDPNAPFVGKTSSTQGSKVPPKAVEYPQREIVNAEKCAGVTPSNDDTTQLAQSIGRGLWIGSLGANANALVGSLGGGITPTAPGILKTLNTWTRLRGLALQTNTSVDVTLTVSGIGTAGGAVTAPLRKRDGVTKPAAGDVPTLWPFEVQYDGTYFRLVGSVASDGVGGSNTSGALNAIVELTTPGAANWTVPSGWLMARAEDVIGGGGGGAGGTGSAGGAGEWASGDFAVTPGSSVPYTVGAGGNGVTSGNAGNGGATAIGGISANGGTGGGAGFATVGQGGTGGTGGTSRKAGGSGGDLDGSQSYATGGTAKGQASTHYTNTGLYGWGEGGSATSSAAAIGVTGANGGSGGIRLRCILAA